jgi:hypothetical protein
MNGANDIKINLKGESSSGLKKTFSISIPIGNNLEITKELSERDLKDIFYRISTLFGYQEIMDIFECTVEEAELIKKFWEANSGANSNSPCKSCTRRKIDCLRCVLVCESPLERDLFLKLIDLDIDPELQLRISKENQLTHYPTPVDPNTILTIPDFYLANGDNKLCIYTDGHTYHERTEYQAMRDRNIDRDLQNFGYTVLRFTGKEVREKMDIVITDIKRALSK